MGIAENFSERLVYKEYATGVIAAGSQPDPTVDPGASGGQVWRHVTQSLALNKDSFRPNEKRQDRQRPIGRHGTRRSPGQVNGLLSPLTHAHAFEACFRGNWSSQPVAGAASNLTSVSASASQSRFTFGGGDPVAAGFRVGMIMRFSDLATVANNDKNFVILGFGGSNNREVTVYPPPENMSADTDFSVSTAGRQLIIPATGHVSRKFAFEVYNTDNDLSRLYTERRFGGFTINMPPNDNIQVTFDTLGRDRILLPEESGAFFGSPAAETSTRFCAGIDGLLRVNGENLGVVNALNLTFTLQPGGRSVLGSSVVPEIFLQDAQIGGNFSAFLEDFSIMEMFDAETEFQLLAYLPTGTEDDTAAMTLLLPNIKLTSNGESDDGSGGKLVNYDFEAGRYFGDEPGVESTSVQLFDTEVA